MDVATSSSFTHSVSITMKAIIFLQNKLQKFFDNVI